MCGTVALFREAQCGALHHLGYRSVSVFPHGSPGAQQNRRNRVHPGSIVLGLKCMQHSLGIRFGIRWSIRFVAFALALGKRRVVEGQNENIQSKKIILMLMRNVTGLCVIHSFNYGVIASQSFYSVLCDIDTARNAGVVAGRPTSTLSGRTPFLWFCCAPGQPRRKTFMVR